MLIVGVDCCVSLFNKLRFGEFASRFPCDIYKLFISDKVIQLILIIIKFCWSNSSEIFYHPNFYLVLLSRLGH